MPDDRVIARPHDRQLSKALQTQFARIRRERQTGDVQSIEATLHSDAPRFQVRKALLDGAAADLHGFERLIGRSDLCAISFLKRGVAAAAAVARVRVTDGAQGGASYGTGFVVAPGLFLTNHHVLPSKSAAEMAVAEFNYEHDVDGVEQQRFHFNFSPGVAFVTDAARDFSLVEIVPRSLEGKALADFGYLPLLRHSGKALEGEYLSIVQHPQGQPKQIAIRDSQVVSLNRAQIAGLDLETFIHYTTDTQPGSSGSPVFNDQWQVVALHHRGVPLLDAQGRPLCRDGRTLWRAGMDDDDRGWAANEGVRVSAICHWLQEQRYTSAAHDSVYHRVRYGLPKSPAPTPAGEQTLEASGPTTAPAKLAGRQGYDEQFLSEVVPLPSIEKRKSAVAKLVGQPTKFRLDYTHFSVVFDKDRRFARFTAVNIDGNRLVRNSDVKATWRRDGRIAEEIQPNDDFYAKKVDGQEIEEVVYFQRGHLVRRVDPSWGDDAVQAVKDTFHFTNACPHTGEFNDRIWGNLEDYLLEKCDREKKRLTVFSGPVFRASDPRTYGQERPGGPYRIPVDYWKVAVIQKDAHTLAAAGFVIGQLEQLGDLEAGPVFSGLHPFQPADLVSQGIQTRIEVVEEITGLNSGALKDLQAGTGLESTKSIRYLYDKSQIRI